MSYIPDRKGTTSVKTAKTSSAKLNSASSVEAVKTTTAQGQYSQTASNVEQVNLDTTFQLRNLLVQVSIIQHIMEKQLL